MLHGTVMTYLSMSPRKRMWRSRYRIMRRYFCCRPVLPVERRIPARRPQTVGVGLSGLLRGLSKPALGFIQRGTPVLTVRSHQAVSRLVALKEISLGSSMRWLRRPSSDFGIRWLTLGRLSPVQARRQVVPVKH
jgi:hypothetical protein